MWCHSHEFQIFTCQILCIFVQAKESYSRHTGGASMGQRVQWTVLDSLTHHAWSLSREWCVVRKDRPQGLRLRSFETVLSGCALHRCRCQTPPSVTPPDQSVAALTTCSVHTLYITVIHRKHHDQRQPCSVCIAEYNSTQWRSVEITGQRASVILKELKYTVDMAGLQAKYSDLEIIVCTLLQYSRHSKIFLCELLHQTILINKKAT